MKTKIIILLFVLSISFPLSAQKIKGKVNMLSTKEGKQILEPVAGASIYWVGTSIGASSNDKGAFEITKPNLKKLLLVASFIGCKSDTIIVDKDGEISFVLKDNNILNDVVVTENLGGTFFSTINPIQTATITVGGLQKMACCNLSESFQNNATVDVGYSDAVSGAKQIQMLGLAGVYSQLMTENIPSIRGLGSAFGISYIPGSWMESIQISKGTSSVVNGYESVTGQINVELKKPDKSEPLFINLYSSDEGRLEANVTSAFKINKTLSTLFLLHGSMINNKIDHNADGFLDVPMSKLLNFSNRWTYNGTNHHTIFIFNIIDEKREGGQKSFYENENLSGTNSYGISVKTCRYQASLKNGHSFSQHTSLGVQVSGTYHNQNSIFGFNSYDATQKSFYVNAIFETILFTSDNKISAGLSYMYDHFDEFMLQNKFQTEYKRNHTETTPGMFVQYSYSFLEKFNFILGLRVDNHNIYGTFFTPRAHMRYQIIEGLIFRASAGQGYRSPNIIAENIGSLASSRRINIADNITYEKAWNYGANITKEFKLTQKRKATFSIDFYRTDFINQVVVDFDKNVHEVNFYNLNGKSFSNSFQTELTIEPIKKLEITAAYRYNDVKMTINNKLLERPYVSKYKGLFTISYSTKYDMWKFDFTSQFNGVVRLPDTKSNPSEFQRNDYSEQFTMLYAQITRKFKHFDIYLGCENILNFMQHHPIVDAQNPFSKTFDASMIWGPISGRMIYTGLRFSIK